MASATQQSGLGDLDLLLIGKSGNGKSSTGNAILGRKAFKAKGGGSSVTKELNVGYRNFDGRVIKVADVPGLNDTDSTEDEQLALVLSAIAESLCLFPDGFKALLLVIKYSSRFTKEEAGAVEALKKMLGSDIVRKNTVVVMTCGDAFKDDEEDDDGVDFQTWVKEQKGPVAELIKECNGRVVLFDNKIKDKQEQRKQLMELISQIDTFRDKQTRYTTANLKTGNQASITEKYSKVVGLVKSEVSRVIDCDPVIGLKILSDLESSTVKAINDLSKESHAHVSHLKKSLSELSDATTEYVHLIELMIKKQMDLNSDTTVLQEYRSKMMSHQTSIISITNNVEQQLDRIRKESGYFAALVGSLGATVGVMAASAFAVEGAAAFTMGAGMTAAAAVGAGAAVAVGGVVLAAGAATLAVGAGISSLYSWFRS